MALAGSLPTPYPYAPDARTLTVTDTAAPLVAESTAKIWASFEVQNNSATVAIYIGNSGSEIFKISPGQSKPIGASDASLWRAKTSSGSADCVVLGARLGEVPT